MRSKVLLLLASTLLCLLAIELGVALSGYRYSPLEIDGTRTDWRGQHAFQDAYHVFDPKQIWKPRPGLAVFNALGYRGPEVPPTRAPGALRILTLGDSNTLGWAGRPVHWPGYLEERLRASGLDVRVLNAGVWGHSSHQGVARLEEFLAFEPDVVTISYGANDAHRVRASDAEYLEREVRWRAELLLHRFGLGQLILAALDAFQDGGSDRAAQVPRVDLAAYRENLCTMVGAARAAGAHCYLLTRPFIGESPHPHGWKTLAPSYLEATHEVGAELGVPVIDVHAEFAGREEWFDDESHFNEAGHRHAADRIAARLASDPALEGDR